VWDIEIEADKPTEREREREREREEDSEKEYWARTTDEIQHLYEPFVDLAILSRNGCCINQ
jgi:hypothetical protein